MAQNKNSITAYLQAIKQGKAPVSGMEGQQTFIQNAGRQMAYMHPQQSQQSMSMMGYADSVQSQIASGLQQRGATNSSVTFTMVSTSLAIETIVIGAPNIFGFGTTANFGNPITIAFAAQTSANYGQFVNSLSSAPAVVGSLRLISSNTPALQFAQLSLSTTTRETTGRTITDIVPQANWINPSQYDPSIFDISNLQTILDGNSYYSFKILPGNTLTVVLNYVSLMDLSQTTVGNAPLTLGNAPLPSQAQIAKLIM